jgi:hypothetical protein
MHRDHLITVEPAAVGWRVALDDLQPLLFLSAGQAEQHARGLAARLSRVGEGAEVMVRDRLRAATHLHVAK